jgi:protocatechuate 3,4-dioxygenase beta subunit
MPGTRIVVQGMVVTTDCKPLSRATLDFWQADARGEYDNAGHRLRGHQLTDEAGRYRLETVVPGVYPGRTRHFHVNVKVVGLPMLTTQLYFPDEPGNERDMLFERDLLLKVRDADGARLADFVFVLDPTRT